VGLMVNPISSVLAAAPVSAPIVVAADAALGPAASRRSEPRDIVSLSSSALGTFGLAEIGNALDPSARVSNTLATADNALSTISGLLGDMQSTTSSSGLDAAIRDQGSIDVTLAAIDHLASTTQFDRQHLLDGSYSTTLNRVSLSIPSMATTSLGVHSLQNDTPNATAILTTALGQVRSVRQQISEFRSQAIQPVTDAGQAAMEQLIASPTIDDSGSAMTQALLLRAQALLQPESSANLSIPNSENVLAYLR
jgi:hypothetical protein